MVGQRWASAWRAHLLAEGRGVVGAWPGTLSEARVRARNHFSEDFERRRLHKLNASELERTARAAYARARRDWLAHAQRDPDERSVPLLTAVGDPR